MAEPRAIRVKRLAMRSMRRGIKEMDLILSAYSDARLADLDDADLDLYEVLLEEIDHDIYAWVSGQAASPQQYAAMIGDIQAHFQPLTK